MEEWKQIAEYPNYWISNFGRVKNSNKILKTQLNPDGYPIIQFRKDGKRCTKTIHRYVGILFINNPDNLTEIDHIDRNRTNNHYTNLRWADRILSSYNTRRNNRYGRYIIKLQNQEGYVVRIRSKICENIYKYFNNLQDAICYRDEIVMLLEEFISLPFHALHEV